MAVAAATTELWEDNMVVVVVGNNGGQRYKAFQKLELQRIKFHPITKQAANQQLLFTLSNTISCSSDICPYQFLEFSW